MGSGYFMNQTVLRNLGHLNVKEYKEVLKILGKGFFIDTCGSREFEDFWTKSVRCATLVGEAMEKDFKEKFGEGASYSVDVIQMHGGFKVSFFK